MFKPPPGYDDLLADAALAPPPGDPSELDVDDVGIVLARHAPPASIAMLAMAANPEHTASDRQRYLAQFVADHLADGEYDRLITQMITGHLPAETFRQVGQAIAVRDTARPYIAVINLAVLTAHHWREIRRRLNASGILNPMQLPTMHSVLEFTETAIVESMQGDDGELKRARFYDSLYAPDKSLLESGEDAPPPGFSPAEVESAFDAFTTSMGSLA